MWQELHLLPQTSETLFLLADLPAFGAAGRLTAWNSVRAEAASAEVVATVQGDGLSKPLQADGAGGWLPGQRGTVSQAQLQLGE